MTINSKSTSSSNKSTKVTITDTKSEAIQKRNSISTPVSAKNESTAITNSSKNSNSKPTSSSSKSTKVTITDTKSEAIQKRNSISTPVSAKNESTASTNSSKNSNSTSTSSSSKSTKTTITEAKSEAIQKRNSISTPVSAKNSSSSTKTTDGKIKIDIDSLRETQTTLKNTTTLIEDGKITQPMFTKIDSTKIARLNKLLSDSATKTNELNRCLSNSLAMYGSLSVKAQITLNEINEGTINFSDFTSSLNQQNIDATKMYSVYTNVVFEDNKDKTKKEEYDNSIKEKDFYTMAADVEKQNTYSKHLSTVERKASLAQNNYQKIEKEYNNYTKATINKLNYENKKLENDIYNLTRDNKLLEKVGQDTSLYDAQIKQLEKQVTVNKNTINSIDSFINSYNNINYESSNIKGILAMKLSGVAYNDVSSYNNAIYKERKYLENKLSEIGQLKEYNIVNRNRLELQKENIELLISYTDMAKEIVTRINSIDVSNESHYYNAAMDIRQLSADLFKINFWNSNEKSLIKSLINTSPLVEYTTIKEDNDIKIKPNTNITEQGIELLTSAIYFLPYKNSNGEWVYWKSKDFENSTYNLNSTASFRGSGNNTSKWCARFVSVILKDSGLANITTDLQEQYLYGLTFTSDMLKYFKDENNKDVSFYRRNEYLPKAGDVIFFSYNDGSTGGGREDNVNHVGLVADIEKLENGDIEVITIEGNRTNVDIAGTKNKGYHMVISDHYNINDNQIIGYGTYNF